MYMIFPYEDHYNLLVNKCHLAIHAHVVTSTHSSIIELVLFFVPKQFQVVVFSILHIIKLKI